MTVQFGIPTFCEYCSSLLWIMEKGSVCQGTIIHKMLSVCHTNKYLYQQISEIALDYNCQTNKYSQTCLKGHLYITDHCL